MRRARVGPTVELSTCSRPLWRRLVRSMTTRLGSAPQLVAGHRDGKGDSQGLGVDADGRGTPMRYRCRTLRAHQARGADCLGIGAGGAHPAAGRPADPRSAHQRGDLVPADLIAGALSAAFHSLRAPYTRWFASHSPTSTAVIATWRWARTTAASTWRRGRWKGRSAAAAQIGSTPNSERWASMKSISSGVGGRVPPRRMPTSRSRSPVAAQGTSCSLIRWRSAVVTPGAAPASMSAWRAQARTDSTP